MTIGKFVDKHHDAFYVFVRVVIGLMFFAHGIDKFASKATGLFMVAGVVEVLVGAALVLGLFSRLAGVGGAITMIVALLTVHLPKGLNPMVNGGEMAIVYLLVFLIVIVHGNSCCSLEKKLFGKEMF